MATEQSIITDFFHHVKASALATAVTGSVCRPDTRPPMANTEDIVLRLVSNIQRADFVEGQIAVLTFVPDISVQGGTGAYTTPDALRIAHLQQLATDLTEHIDPHTAHYVLQRAGQTRTMADEDGSHQHFFTTFINFKLYTP